MQARAVSWAGMGSRGMTVSKVATIGTVSRTKSRLRAAHSTDHGCVYGGPFCTCCTLPRCVEELSHEERCAFTATWRAARHDAA